MLVVSGEVRISGNEIKWGSFVPDESVRIQSTTHDGLWGI
jgi:hypothetical protein